MTWSWRSAPDPVIKRLRYANVKVHRGDGYQGWREHVHFDGIIVTAATPAIPPSLIEQLKPRRKMVIPVESPYGREVLSVVSKDDSGYATTKELFPVAFLPLTGNYQRQIDNGDKL